MSLPIRTTTRPAAYPRGWHMAKSGIGINTVKSGPKAVLGFAIGEDPEEVAQRSRYEVMERTYAHYDLFREKHLAALPLLHWKTGEFIGERQAETVLFSHPALKRGWVDANGLAWQSSTDKAVASGLWEVVERHQLSCFWHMGQTKLVMLDSQPEEGFVLETYTTADAVPFGLVVARGHANEFLVCGSAAADTLEGATKKARCEAYMMLDGVLKADRGPANSPVSQERVLGLRNANLSIARQEHILNCLTSLSSVPKVTGIEHALVSLGFESKGAGYCLLREDKEGSLVRCFISGARNPKEFEQDSNIPLDPFC